MKLKYTRILIFTSISEKKKHGVCVQSTSQMHGEVPFCTYVHRASAFSIVRYDVFAYGTAYLISPTKSNDPDSGFYGAFPTTQGHLSVLMNRSY